MRVEVHTIEDRPRVYYLLHHRRTPPPQLNAADSLTARLYTEDKLEQLRKSYILVERDVQEIPQDCDHLRRLIFVRDDAHRLVGGSKEGWIKALKIRLNLEFVHKAAIEDQSDFWRRELSYLSTVLGVSGVRIPNKEKRHVLKSKQLLLNNSNNSSSASGRQSSNGSPNSGTLQQTPSPTELGQPSIQNPPTSVNLLPPSQPVSSGGSSGESSPRQATINNVMMSSLNTNNGNLNTIVDINNNNNNNVNSNQQMQQFPPLLHNSNQFPFSLPVAEIVMNNPLPPISTQALYASNSSIRPQFVSTTPYSYHTTPSTSPYTLSNRHQQPSQQQFQSQIQQSQPSAQMHQRLLTTPSITPSTTTSSPF